MLQRRTWLQRAGAAGMLGALGCHAQAQQVVAGDYKALVCVFLFGGNDGNNMVVPLGDGQADYAKARAAAGLAIAPDQLVPLPDAAGTVQHGLHPALKPLEGAWAQQQLALLFFIL